jgi:16S rRNA (guanine527-N7)-methyltransferase
VKHPESENLLAGLDVSRETLDRLGRFVDLLRRWNGKINLVAPADLHAIWQRHVADSLQLVPLVPAGASRAIDLGSGAGFPGLVLSIGTGIAFDLVESDQRKAAFLREAARVTAAPATVHCVRAERASLQPAPLVTARALAPLPRLLDLVAPFLAPDGIALLPKGVRAQAELTEAAAGWQMQVDQVPSRTGPDATILQIRNLRRVGRPR